MPTRWASSATGEAVPFDLEAGAEVVAVGVAVGGEPGGAVGEVGGVGAEGHQVNGTAGDVREGGEVGGHFVQVGGLVDDELHLERVVER